MTTTEPGFTLLEVLLACTLLAILGAATFGWVASQSRASRAAQVRLNALTAEMACVRLLTDDLALAVPDNAGQLFNLVDEHAVTMTTLMRYPGEEPGFHQVLWRYRTASRLLERAVVHDDPLATPSARVVSSHLDGLRFSAPHEGGLIAHFSQARGDTHAEVAVAVGGGER